MALMLASAMPGRVHEVDVNELASLVRLDLTAEEQALFASQLSGIIAFARQVQGVDTASVPPTSRAAGSGIPERDDVAGSCLAPDAALANAPERSGQGAWFKVPKVIGS